MSNESLYDYSKLKGRIKEKFDTQKNFIKEINMSETTFIQKITDNVDFKRREIQEICSILDIDLNEIPEYFFTPKVKNILSSDDISLENETK